MPLPETILESQTVFKAKQFSGEEMDSFDRAYAESKQITDRNIWIPLYMKVGLFCGWSWKEFKETPYSVIKGINEEIDRRLESIDSDGGFVHWFQFFVMLAVAKLFGGK